MPGTRVAFPARGHRWGIFVPGVTRRVGTGRRFGDVGTGRGVDQWESCECDWDHVRGVAPKVKIGEVAWSALVESLRSISTYSAVAYRSRRLALFQETAGGRMVEM